MTGVSARVETFAALIGATVAIVALLVSAYQSNLMRLELQNFRQANLNQKILDGCVEYLVRARDFESSFYHWTGKVIGDGPKLSNDFPAADYVQDVRLAGLEMSEKEALLEFLGSDLMRDGIKSAASARTAAFLMLDDQKTGSRENVDLWFKQLDDGINAVQEQCYKEIGRN